MGNYKPYQKYKKSEIPWLREIPEQWEIKTINNCFIERKERVSDKDYKPLSVTKHGIVPQLENTAKTIHGDNRKKVSKGDFVINSRSDRKGSSGIAKEDGSVSLINIVLEPNTICSRFSEYTLKCYSFKEEFYRFGRGIVADLWTTRYAEMKKMYIPSPPPQEQITIANFLDYKLSKINRFIRKKKQLIQLLQEQKIAIINQAVTKGLNSNTKMKESGIKWLGKIPEHWEVKELKHLAEVKTGKTPKIESSLIDYFLEGNINWYTPGDIKNGGIISESNRKINHKAIEDSRISIFPKNSVYLICIGGTIGKVGISFIESSCNQQINAIVFNESINPLFAFYYLKSQKHQIDFLADFTTLPILNQSKTKSIIFSFPPLSEQQQIISHIEQETIKIDTTISKIEKELALVKEYKTALISEAVTGKIDVRDFVLPKDFKQEKYEAEEEISVATKEFAKY